MLANISLNPNKWINTELKATNHPPRRLIPFIRWCVEGAGLPISIAIAASITLGFVETFIAAMIGYLLDLVLVSSPKEFVSENWAAILVGTSFLFLVRPVVFHLSSYFQNLVVGPGLKGLVAVRLHRWTLGHSKNFFDSDYAGRIAQQEIQAADSVTDAVVEIIHTVLFAMATVLASFWIISMIDWRVGLIVALWALGFFFLMRFFLPRLKRCSASRADAQARATGQIVDTISNISLVKLFANSRREDRAAIDAFANLRTKMVFYGKELITFRTCMVLYSGTIFFAVSAACVFLWARGHVTPGEVVAAGSVAMRIMMMAGWVSFSLMMIYTNLGNIEDSIATLVVPRSMEDSATAKPINVRLGRLNVENISFQYSEHKQALTAVSIDIKPKEKLGLVGSSGAGKSTLVSGILRLHDPDEGRILIDGQDITEVTQDSLRQNISVVTQETSVFNRSAYENLAYGRPGALYDEVIDATKKAGAHEFVMDLIDDHGRRGYEAHLGERGVKLSGGQRQRIALARAILKDAPILILDEATSALDSETEAQIQGALEKVMEGKTVVAIAHRLSTVSNMDRIVVMEAGAIIEQGTHSELLRRNGTYAGFWSRQSGGFLGVEDAA